MTDWFPDEPEVPESQRGSGPSGLRYEDVSQDGRLMLIALPHTIGDVVWRTLVPRLPMAHKFAHSGVIPILTRFVLEGGGGPISVRHPLEAHGCHQMFHTVDARGEVDRLMWNMWTRVFAPRGRTNGPPLEGAGEPVFVGRCLTEHVFTRLFAPPSERKVLRLELGGVEVEGMPAVPPSRWTWRPPEAVLAPPAGARALDAQLAPDEAEVAFGLEHTDSNQHVNSLVYPRLFVDAGLRRIAAHGRSTGMLARRIEIAYRKPCFAGQRARMWLQAFEDGESVVVAGVFASETAPPARPHCTIQVRFTL